MKTGSTLWLGNTGQDFSLRSFQKLFWFESYHEFPKVLATPKVIPLKQLTLPKVPSIAWSRGDKSLTIDVIIVCFCVVIGVYYHCVRNVAPKAKESVVEGIVQIPMLNKTEGVVKDTDNISTPRQAATFLLSSEQGEQTV